MYPGALLAQEACSYQAMTQLLMRMRGRLTVLIHSDRDCSNVLPKTGGRIHSDQGYKFLCTNLREDEIVTGQGNAKLRRAIELVTEAYHPDLLVILSTCPTVMIGDNIKQVSRKAAKDLGVRISAELTHGLKPKSPAEIVDDCYTMLCRSAAEPQHLERARRVNLVGVNLDDSEQLEIEQGLAQLGLTLNVVLSERADLSAFLRVADAGYNIHPGPNMLLEFDKLCAERWQMTAIEVPLPVGVRASDRFWQAIAQATASETPIAGHPLAQSRAQAVAAITEFETGPFAQARDEHNRTPRCAYNVGSVRSFDLRRIALEELGDLPFFEELGFDCALFIQGPLDAGNIERTRGVLSQMGVEHPFVIFPDPGGLARWLRPGDFDVFFGADFLRDQLTKLNLPLLNHRQLGIGYAAVIGNLALVNTALTTRFYDHFAATPPPAVSQPPSGRLRPPAQRGPHVRRTDAR